MDRRFYRFLQFLVLAGLGIFLAYKYLSGSLSWYINQRYMPLTILAILGLLGMALTAVFSARKPPHSHADGAGDHDHDGHASGGAERVSSAWGIVFIFIPLFIGLAIPAKPLSASAISNRGLSSGAPLSAGGGKQANLNLAPEDRTVLDWIKLFNYATDISPYLGQNANVIGFVYHDTRLPAGHFMVSRFAITCCVADAFAIGMVVEPATADTYPDNTWIDVKGSVQSIDVDGQKLPLIVSGAITRVQAPQQPYLFP